METIEGFNISKRELTEEEAIREITLDRIINFNNEVGEDFLDQVGSLNNDKIALTFCGFAMLKHPELSHEFLKATNRGHVYTQVLKEVYDDNMEGFNSENMTNIAEETFYSDFAEFLNLTEYSKKRANQVLIQVAEHYKYDD